MTHYPTYFDGSTAILLTRSPPSDEVWSRARCKWPGHAEDTATATESMTAFQPAWQKEVLKAIRCLATKSCPIHPLPTWMLKQHIGTLLPTITKIVNLSMATGTFPFQFKKPLVTPLLKKLSLDVSVLTNYRLVSNLPYISKVTEKVVAVRLLQYVQENGMQERMQSAYRAHHSTETALVRVSNDLLCAIDQRKAVILILLDLSAAFDTIDHDILLQRLQRRYGITHIALEWFRSYLTDRQQCVHLSGGSSRVMRPGLGSVFPKARCWDHLFSYCTRLLSAISLVWMASSCIFMQTTLKSTSPFAQHLTRTLTQQCARSTHVSQTFGRGSSTTGSSSTTQRRRLCSCVPLMHMRSKLSVLHLEVGVSRIVPPDVVRNVGAFFDQNLNKQHHVKQLCRKASFQLWNIGRIRHLLNAKTAETLVHAYITSRLDCGNALLYGRPEPLLRQLQSVQNTAARIVTRAGKQAHSKDLPEQLHWLSVSFRVDYKIILLTFRALHGLAPVYLSQLLTVYRPTRTLRCHSQLLLRQPKSRLKTYGDRAFSHAAPGLWNALPSDLRAVNCLDNCKINLKTYLFKKAFHRLHSETYIAIWTSLFYLNDFISFCKAPSNQGE